MSQKLEVHVPLVTPALEDAPGSGRVSVDVLSIPRLLSRTQSFGADGGVALGWTGEFSKLNIANVVSAAAGFVLHAREINFPLIVNVTGRDDKDTIDRFEAIKGLRPDGIMFAPMFGEAPQVEAYNRFLRLGICCSMHLYDNVGITDNGPIPHDWIRSYAQSDRIELSSVKISCGTPERVGELLQVAKECDFKVRDGKEVHRDSLHLLAHEQHGGTVPSGGQLSDIYARHLKELSNVAYRDEAEALTNLYTEIGQASASGAKTLLYMFGVLSSPCVFGDTRTISPETETKLADYAHSVFSRQIMGEVEGHPDLSGLAPSRAINLS